MKAHPATSSISWIAQMLGWFSEDAAGLPLEMAEGLRVVGEFFRKELQRNVPTELQAFRPYNTHATAANLAEYAVVGNRAAPHTGMNSAVVRMTEDASPTHSVTVAAIGGTHSIHPRMPYERESDPVDQHDRNPRPSPHRCPLMRAAALPSTRTTTGDSNTVRLRFLICLMRHSVQRSRQAAP
jgi:hypothetical protein